MLTVCAFLLFIHSKHTTAAILNLCSTDFLEWKAPLTVAHKGRRHRQPRLSNLRLERKFGKEVHYVTGTTVIIRRHTGWAIGARMQPKLEPLYWAALHFLCVTSDGYKRIAQLVDAKVGGMIFESSCIRTRCYAVPNYILTSYTLLCIYNIRDYTPTPYAVPWSYPVIRLILNDLFTIFCHWFAQILSRHVKEIICLLEAYSQVPENLQLMIHRWFCVAHSIFSGFAHFIVLPRQSTYFSVLPCDQRHLGRNRKHEESVERAFTRRTKY